MYNRNTISMLCEEPSINEQIDKENEYELDQEIASGMHGSVYFARTSKTFDQPTAQIRQSIQPRVKSKQELPPINQLQRSTTEILSQPIQSKSLSSQRTSLLKRSSTLQLKMQRNLSFMSLSDFKEFPQSKSTLLSRKITRDLKRKETIGVLYNKQSSFISNPESVAMKQQFIKRPKEQNEPSYIECHIFKQLNKLMEKRYSNNFIYLYEWYKSYVDDIETLIEQKKKRIKSDQQINFIMEIGQTTFFNWKKANKPMNIYELKEIMFQVIWALMIAQKELQFMHNDLHAKNIMINTSETKHYYYNNSDKRIWCCPSFVVKLCDFGSAQITHKNERTKKKETWGIDPSPFNEMVDRNKFAESLNSITFESCDDIDNQKKMFNEVKRMLKFNSMRYLTLKELLYLPFFDSMVHDIEQITDDMSIYSYSF